MHTVIGDPDALRSGAAAGHQGYFHEALYYSSDAELLAVAVPFLLGGPAAGEPTIVSLGARTAELVRAELPADSGVIFLAGGDTYARPTATIRTYRRMLAAYVAAGAAQIRIIGEVPGLGSTWDWWARYESAINHAYDDFPLWGMCAYDTRLAPAPVLADVARTHPRSATPDGRHAASPAYTDPAVYLAENRPPVPDPLQAGTPAAELARPTPGQARHAVRRLGAGLLAADEVEDLVVAVSETVTNAVRYGGSPHTVRVWTGPDRIVVEVSDTGTGPADPFAGLLPVTGVPTGGRGLWITHQACNHVASWRTADAFLLRMTAGNPHR